MKKTCPTCKGAGLVTDLSIVDPSLSFPQPAKGKIRVGLTDGFPPLSCKTCLGQGVVDAA